MGGAGIKTFKDLIVWQKALDLSVKIYQRLVNFLLMKSMGFLRSFEKHQGPSHTTSLKVINVGVQSNISVS